MYRIKSTLLILIILTLISGSCIRFKKDRSFTVKQYMALGLSDPKIPMTFQDYYKPQAALSKIKMVHPLAFPRKNSRRSGKVFKSFVNKDNLAFVNDPNIPLSEKAFRIQYFSRSQSTIIQLYSDPAKDEQYYSEELIDLNIFELYVDKKMLELAGEIMKSSNETDMSMQSGRGAVVGEYIKLISYLFEEQVKSKVYSSGDLNRLSEEVSNSIIDNLKWFEPSDRQKLTVEMQKIIENSPSEKIKENYRKALMVL